jgi:hypothetical protein
MADRRLDLSRVFGYGLLAMSVVLFLTALPLEFALGPNWAHILEGVGLTAFTVLMAVFLLKYLRLAPYGWIVGIVVAMSAIAAMIAAGELSDASLPRLFPQPLITIPQYIVFAASGLFVLANIVAIIVTAVGGSSRPDSGGSRRQE